ncbi:MAG TPA: magnesium-translocating P-type ATPase [Gammaproteobacteria bacterium]|nr:magnesium-translocating P-type ATPase [Gammaproteobacteria bacterium]
MSQPAKTIEAAFWNLPLDALLARLDAHLEGLTQAEAKDRLRRYGPNVLQKRPERALMIQFLLRLNNPLILLLLAASAVSAFTGEVAGALIIGVMVIASVALDFAQERHAERTAEKLRQSVAVHAQAVRDGQPREVMVAKIVPGDIVLLTAGDIVSADGRVLEARDFFVNQALLTGEPYPVEKHPGDLAGTVEEMGGAQNTVFMGASVVSGMAKILVCATGAETSVGGIAQTLARKAPRTAFELGTRQFGLLILRMTFLLVVFVLLVNALFHRPMLESLLFALALAVGLTPELLPMVVTVTLARGALRMAKKHVVVKQMIAIQNLGSMDVLCTDKTGTLTEAHIRLERHLDAYGRDSSEVLRLAYLNSYFETGLKSPLDEAILEHEEIDVSAWKKIDEVPFDFERRRVSVLVDNGTTRLLAVKGSPEDILRLSTHYAAGAEAAHQPLDQATLSRIQSLYDDLGREGFRVLGIAFREVARDHPHAVVSDETGLVFAGLAAFLDPPKQSAAGALAALAGSGVAVKVITGDNELVTRHVCKELGLAVTGMLNGSQIQQLDDQALQAHVEAVNLFCRVTPAQKNRIILALKARGHTVGYLGDGVNDAPSLHSADIGISVDSAVDVAKEAAEMILLRRDLHVLHDGVLEGRRTFGNVMKYIMMATSSNFGNMFSMAGAALVLPFIPMLPLQILLNNFLYDISEIAIPLDSVDEDDLKRPRHWDMAFVRNFMLSIGPVSSVFDFLTFYVMLKFLHAGEALFQTGWFVESLATQVLVIFVIRTRGNPFKSRPHAWLIWSSLIVVAVGALLPYTPLAAQLGFVPLPPAFFVILGAMVAVYLVMVEMGKRWFYRHFVTS